MKWITDINVKPITTKLSDKKKGENLCYHGLGKDLQKGHKKHAS